jgi:hypothetical protein
MNERLQKKLNDYYKATINEQQEELELKIEELIDIGYDLGSLPISTRWKVIFTKMAYSRGFVKISPSDKDKIVAIASVNSDSVFALANHGKKAGIRELYNISVKEESEHKRNLRVQKIIETGIKESKDKSDRDNQPSLFDW